MPTAQTSNPRSCSRALTGPNLKFLESAMVKRHSYAWSRLSDDRLIIEMSPEIDRSESRTLICEDCSGLHLNTRYNEVPFHHGVVRDSPQVDLLSLQRNTGQCSGCLLVCRAVAAIGIETECERNIEVQRLSDSRGSMCHILVLRIDRGRRTQLGTVELNQISGKAQPWLALLEPAVEVAIPRSDEAYARLQSWLTECANAHTRCNPKASAQHAARLIDIGSTDSTQIHLIPYDGQGRPEYVALSHCWGDPATLPKTTLANLEQHHDNIPLSSLSRTFRDALEISHRLGLRYLWIDALCIVQDDRSDWLRESAKMGAIFGGAYLTLSAMASSDGRGGCWPPAPKSIVLRDPGGVECEVSVKRPTEDSRTVHASCLDAYEIDCTTNPLAGRKWSYQERFLSRRTIHFTAEELIWVCEQRSSCECDRMGLSRTDLATPWRTVVHGYTHGALKFDIDMLPAIGGVAESYACSDRGWYLAGLWREDLPRALLWSSEVVGLPGSIRSVINTRPSVYTAPSWSWASVKGKVLHRNLWIEEMATVLDVACEPEGESLYGRVLRGFLDLDCNVAHISADHFPSDSLPMFQPMLGTLMSSLASFDFDTTDDQDVCILDGMGQFLCALIGCQIHESDAKHYWRDYYALALAPQHNGTYRRFGFVQGVWYSDKTLDEQISEQFPERTVLRIE